MSCSKTNECTEEQSKPGEDPAETIVRGAVESLRSSQETDQELLRILSETVLKLPSTDKAVTEALNAIASLAAKRAESSSDDEKDHD